MCLNNNAAGTAKYPVHKAGCILWVRDSCIWGTIARVGRENFRFQCMLTFNERRPLCSTPVNFVINVITYHPRYGVPTRFSSLMFILAECTLSQAIWRDGYRCMFSGKIDEATYDSLQATIE